VTNPLNLLRYLAASIALAYILLFLFVAVQRIGYPYELEWMEGGMVDHIRRLQSGERLYTAPSIDFVPFIYPPVFFYAGSALTTVIGVDFLPLRLIALLSTLGVFGMIALIVQRETKDKTAALIGTGLFAATYALSGAWMDMGRIDMPFMVFALLAVYVVRFEPVRGSVLLSALLLVVAGLTKQTALGVAVGMFAYLLLTNWRKGLLFGAIVGGLTFGVTLLIDLRTDGWYSFYMFDLPRQHGSVNVMLVDFWRVDMLPVAVAGFITVACILSWFRDARDKFLFYGFLLGSMVCSAWLSRIHEGGYLNVLIPAFAGISILFGIGITHFKEWRWIYPLALLQLMLLIYNPSDFVPIDADHAAGDHLIEVIQRYEGEVLVVHRGNLNGIAGNNVVHAHRMAIDDVMRGQNEPARLVLQESIDTVLNQKRFDAIIFDGTPDDFILVDYYFRQLEPNYQGVGEVFPPEFDGAYWPLSGSYTRPYFIFEPRP